MFRALFCSDDMFYICDSSSMRSLKKTYKVCSSLQRHCVCLCFSHIPRLRTYLSKHESGTLRNGSLCITKISVSILPQWSPFTRQTCSLGRSRSRCMKFDSSFGPRDARSKIWKFRKGSGASTRPCRSTGSQLMMPTQNSKS